MLTVSDIERSFNFYRLQLTSEETDAIASYEYKVTSITESKPRYSYFSYLTRRVVFEKVTLSDLQADIPFVIHLDANALFCLWLMQHTPDIPQLLRSYLTYTVGKALQDSGIDSTYDALLYSLTIPLPNRLSYIVYDQVTLEHVPLTDPT